MCVCVRACACVRKEAYETACFIGKIDKFFDTLNVSSFQKGKHKRKVFQIPFRSPNDFRLTVRSYLIASCYYFIYK